MRALTTCTTSGVLWLCLSLYSAFSMECLALGCTVTEPSHTVSCSVVAAARLCETVVLGIRDTRVRSLVSNDIDRDQQAQKYRLSYVPQAV